MMILLPTCVLLLMLSTLGESYSKYGRTCKDIGCLSNEECVMENDPCSYYQRDNECGSYPTCKSKTSTGPRTCSTFICPPTQVCKMEGNRPRCFDDTSKANRAVGYDTSEVKDPKPAERPSNLYPSVPRGRTTVRPGIGRPQPGGTDYRGGAIGSGYPGAGAGAGAAGGYPQQGYPNYPQGGAYPNYPQQGYPGYQNRGGYQGYPQQGYPQQGYPTQGYGSYPSQYPNNYYQQNGYSPYNQNRYKPQNSGSEGGIVDKLTEALKSYGLFYISVAYFCQWIRGF